MKFDTELGEVEIDDKLIALLKPDPNARNARTEVERIIRYSMQAESELYNQPKTVARRGVISKIAAESTRHVMRMLPWYDHLPIPIM